MHKIFRYPKFSETLKGCPQIFSALWDKKFSTENCDTLLCIKFFDTPNFLKHWRDAHEIFRHFAGKLWYPLLCIKFFDTPNFLKHWWDAHEIFRHCETKIFRRKNVIPPSMHKIFRYPKFSETLKGCPRNFSSIKLFETKNFLKNSRIPLQKFSALWDIKISTENRDMPPLIHKFFSIPENFQKTRVPLQSFSFRSCETKSSDKTVMPPLSYAWKFSIKEFFWNNTKVFSNEIFRYNETKNFRRKILILPLYPNFFGTRN